jgi:glycosyltransferase involved in cell wall biosynthesis
VTIHDLSVLRFPHYFRTWFRNYARWVLPRTARSARAVITVSEAIKQELIGELALPPERITVVSNGVTSEFRAEGASAGSGRELRQKYDLPKTFVLSVGTIEPRKNLVRLIEAIQQLRRRDALADVHLVHAGPTGWMGADVSKAVAQFTPRHAVRFLGLVPRADLPSLFREARLLAYPSLYEGFGLPVLEAMACGCPVVTSDRSALPEITAGAAVLVDPTSVEAIADGIARVWQNDTLRDDLARRGIARAAHFSWDRCARETARVYERAMNALP